MREVKQVDISYSNDEYEAGSVFVGCVNQKNCSNNMWRKIMIYWMMIV